MEARTSPGGSGTPAGWSATKSASSSGWSSRCRTPSGCDSPSDGPANPANGGSASADTVVVTGFKPPFSLRKPGNPALLSHAVPTSRATWRRWICRCPVDGTKRTHGPERDLFKACVLGVQYGMGAASLAGRIGKPFPYAVELLRLHRETYPRFWAWSDGAESHAMLLNRLHTTFGWTVRVGADANPRSLRNFPCQANGAEMLRLACCLALERGVSIIAPVHDAVIVESPEWDIEDAVAETREAMAEASAVILDGFRLRSDAKIVRWPERYMDDRGREFWGRVMALIPATPEAGAEFALTDSGLGVKVSAPSLSLEMVRPSVAFISLVSER